ncbi:MAG: hypothetical protein JW781_10180 [Deltaproteobacteria bacterium]|nr:hypothetical protein [Candidatus Anaeroferrophillacea bacterium]
MGYLLPLYGSDVDRWPATARRERAAILARQPDLAVLVTAERCFESLLANQPQPPAAPADLAARIVAAALPTARRPPEPASLRGFITRLFADFHLPAPAIVMATMLLAGIIIGFSLPMSTGITAAATQPAAIGLQAALDYQGEIL